MRARSSAAALLLAAAACAGSDRATVPEDAEPRLGDAWFAWRADQLGITAQEARARDAALPEDEPPEGLDTPALRREAAAMWQSLCASCHGANGRLENVPEMEPMPKKWSGMGPDMGFFFGGDKMRAGIYRSIRDGGEPVNGEPSPMPAWGDALAREQMWLLVRYLETF